MLAGFVPVVGLAGKPTPRWRSIWCEPNILFVYQKYSSNIAEFGVARI